MRRVSAMHMRGLVIGLLVMAASPAAVAAWWMTPTFSQADTRPKSLAILPPKAKMVRHRAITSEEATEEALAIEDVGVDRLAETMRERGYQVQVVSQERLAGDPKLQDLVRAANARYEDEVSRLALKPKKVKVGRYQVGDPVSALATYLDVDAAVFLRVEAHASMGGRVVVAALVGGSAPQGALMSVGVATRRKGMIEAFFTNNTGASTKELEERPEETMADLGDRIMKNWPAADENKKIRLSRSDRAAFAAANAIEERSEEELLGELEGLLEE